MQKFIDKLHFITHDLPQRSHTAQVQDACNAGAKWVQYRCFSKSEKELEIEINQIAEICDDWGTTLIVTDHLQMANYCDIQGFHIEDMEADFSKIRDLIGESYTLGGSANTLQQAIRIAQAGVDYLGVGPFASTVTKPNDFPLISLNDYKLFVESLRENNVYTPILAVGGIELKDIANLMKTGIFGVALSNALNTTTDFYETYQQFKNAITP